MNDLQNQLIQIGFTEYEAKAYLALLKEHPVSGYQVSKNSGVPRSMVYEVLSRLRSRGAVLETIEDRATYYRPLAPEILLSQYEDRLQTLLTELRPGLTNLYEATQDDRLWSITGQSAILIYCQQMLHKAQEEVYLVLNDEILDSFIPWLEKLAPGKIKLHILQTGLRQVPAGEVSYHPPLESELQGLTDLLLLIVDNQEVLISGSGVETRATITANPNTILIARQFIWMEFFTQRIYNQLGSDLLDRLSPEDRQIFESMAHHNHQE
jgi:sugar-specific transcriptional regulator TrmB